MTNQIISILALLALWGIIGYFLAPIMLPKPKTRKEGIVQLIISGPIFWLIFPFYILLYKKK